jgi:hypothetical protein
VWIRAARLIRALDGGTILNIRVSNIDDMMRRFLTYFCITVLAFTFGLGITYLWWSRTINVEPISAVGLASSI